MQFKTANIEYESRSFSTSMEFLNVALGFVWVYTLESPSKAFRVAFKSCFEILCCIQALARAF